MDSNTPLEIESNNSLDIMGQLPGLKIYTQVCFCYSVPENTSHPQLINTLRAGLKRLSASFPWVAARVEGEGVTEVDSGAWKFGPLEATPRLIVKDLHNDSSIPSMETMREAKFPMAMLEESIIAPIVTIPALAPDHEGAKDSPVFALQASFIKGGLLLTFVSEHRTMDGVGFGQILRLFSKACRGEEFSPDELSSGNLNRKDLIPLLKSPYKPGPELQYQIIKPLAETPTIESPPAATSTWANFSFSSNSLKILKSRASQVFTIPSGQFVSTDDALSAFIWQSITRCRISRLDASSEVKFARAVNVRHVLGVPATYTGIIQNMTYHTIPAQKLVESSLGAISSNLRHAIDPKTSTLLYDTRSLATQISLTADKSIFSFTANFDPPQDVMLSSWSKLNSYDLDFGLGLGKPLALRRPKFVPVEGLGYLLPKTPEGEVVFALCLRDEDFENLRKDEDWCKYAEYIG